ncbi:MAG: hypothetical protein QOG20_5183 [Pseudonocardiales bacterium]|nr:hypothetical protein [Pseudonocardiales bacterium]
MDAESAAGPVAAAAEVVVGVDGTASALRAVSWATAEARLRGRPLRIVHAAPSDMEGRRRAQRIVAQALSMARRRDPDLAMRTEVFHEQPVRALVQASEGAALLVVGIASGHPGEVVVGSVAFTVVDTSLCPVAVVRGHHRAPGRGRPVLLGVDSPVSDAAAFGTALADADRHGSRLVVLHVRHADMLERLAGIDLDTTLALALSEHLIPWQGLYPGVGVDIRIEHGQAADRLLHAAGDARLVVVSTRGGGTATRHPLNSCSRQLLRYSPSPVCVVPRNLDAPAGPTVDRAAVPTASAVDAPNDRSVLW